MSTGQSILARSMPFLAFVLASTASYAVDAEKIPVTIEPLSTLTVYPEQSAPAMVISLNHSQISAQLAARIERVYVRVGDQVKKGARLIRLDCRDQKLALESANTRRQLAKKELDRAVILRKTSNIAEQNYNQAETEMNQARIARQQQQVFVGRCNLTSPFQGVVTARMASLGALAAPGTPLIELLDTEHLEVSAQVARDDLVTLRAARQLQLRIGDTLYPLSLRAITPVINAQAQNQEVRLEFKQKNSLPGASGRLVWTSRHPHIAASLLSQREQQIGIFIAEGDQAKFLPLPNAKIGHPAVVDFPGKTMVILEGRFTLNDGDTIRIVK